MFIDKDTPYLEFPIASILIAGRSLSFSNLIGGLSYIDGTNTVLSGTFDWFDGTEIIMTAGTFDRDVIFVPEDTANYYTSVRSVQVQTIYLILNFLSHENSEPINATYGSSLSTENFPEVALWAGYSGVWEQTETIENITTDLEINAIYTLLNPTVTIEGYTEAVVYGNTVTLTAVPAHELATAVFSYEWYYNYFDSVYSTSNTFSLENVAESGNYGVKVYVTDGEQTKYVCDEIYVDIQKAETIFDADLYQTYTYDGTIKNIVASINHNETDIIYSPKKGYTEANENGYNISLLSIETDNYLSATKNVHLIINKDTIDMSNVIFDDKTFVYDGESHSIYVKNVPVQINSISYSNNSLTSVGSVEVEAEYNIDENNYNSVDNMSATIYIVQREIDITINNKTSIYGEPFVLLTYEATNNIPGDDLGISLIKEIGNQVDSYTIMGEMTNPNYTANIVEGIYTITKATYDMQGVSFPNKTVVYDTFEHSLAISGTLPNGVQVSYNDNSGTDAGSYDIVATYSYDEHNYNDIADMNAVLTISQREITVTFSNYSNLFYDGEIKEISATLNNLIAGKESEIEPIITYDGEVREADYYTATASINNDNYKLVGDTSIVFIVYKKEVYNTDEIGKDVVVFAEIGFLPDTIINVKNVSQRSVIDAGLFAGKEIKQTFDINFVESSMHVGSGENTVQMKLLIGSQYLFLENLTVGKLNADGSIEEIESTRDGEYLIFEVNDTDGTYIIIGEGKHIVKYILPAIGGLGFITIMALIIKALVAASKKKLVSKIIGL